MSGKFKKGRRGPSGRLEDSDGYETDSQLIQRIAERQDVQLPQAIRRQLVKAYPAGDNDEDADSSPERDVRAEKLKKRMRQLERQLADRDSLSIFHIVGQVAGGLTLTTNMNLSIFITQSFLIINIYLIGDLIIAYHKK